MSICCARPKSNTGNEGIWQGPGYYNIWDANDSTCTIQYCHSKADIKETFWDVERFEFIRKSIPRVYAEIAKANWKGQGYYVVTKIREIAWVPDTDCMSYARDVKCLADGLFRNFDLAEIVNVRKMRRGEDCSCMPYFECPDVFHGWTCP